MFLEISQNSHENTCTRISFLIKLQASVSNFIKKEAQVFSCGFCEFFKNTFSYRARPECFWNKTSGYLNKRLWNRCFLLNVAIFLRNLFYPIINADLYVCTPSQNNICLAAHYFENETLWQYSLYLVRVWFYYDWIIHELLFRHIFETKIHIQTQIRKIFILAIATNDFL